MGYFLSMFIGCMAGIGVYEYISAFVARRRHRRKDEKFLYFVRVNFPDADSIEFIAVDNSDELAMKKIERKIRDASRTL